MTEIISKDGTRFTGLAEADTIEIKADKTIVNANSGDDTLTLTKGNGNEIYMDSDNDTIILTRTAGKNNTVDGGNEMTMSLQQTAVTKTGFTAVPVLIT